MLQDFAGKIAIVTGSSRGIGYAAARLLALRGATVVISSRKAEACDAVRDAFLAEGLQAVSIPAHAGNIEDCHRLVDQTFDQFGRLDVLVPNAAINPVFEPLSELTEATWQKMLDVNVSSTWRLVSRALPLMRPQKSGAIVAVSSINGQFAVHRSGAYGVTKAALNHMVRQLAAEAGADNIRVNAVAPGTTRTDMIRALTAKEEYVNAVVARTPLRRLGEPEDVAEAIAFLASDGARHITGQILTVDGGETIMRS